MIQNDNSELINYKAQNATERDELYERVESFYRSVWLAGNTSPSQEEIRKLDGLQRLLQYKREDQNTLALLWEKLQGTSLADEYANHRRMPLDEARDCLRQITGQLTALHRVGFSLRDLNLDTIVVSGPPGFVTRNDPTLKPAYRVSLTSIFSKLSELSLDARTCRSLAPEELSAVLRPAGMLASEPGALSQHDVSSPRANVYKLALLLSVLLTGNPSPFDRVETQPSQIIRQHLHDKPALRGLQKQLRPLFLRALSKDPSQRPTIDEFLWAFEETCKTMSASDGRRRQPSRMPDPPAPAMRDERQGKHIGRFTEILSQVMTRRRAIQVTAAAITIIASPGLSTGRLFGDVGDMLPPFTEHNATVNALSLSPDGTLMLSADQDGRLIVWNAITRFKLLDDKLQHNKAPIVAVAWWKNNQICASLSSDGMLWLWQFQNGQYVPFAAGSFAKPAKAITFAPDGNHLVVGSADDLLVFDFAPNNPFGNPDTPYEGRSAIDHGFNSVNSIAIARDGTFGASGWNDATVRTWSLDTGKTLFMYPGHSREVSSVALSPDGQWVASASVDRSVQVWNAQHGNVSVLYHHVDAVNCITWSPDGRYVASGGDDQVVRIYDMLNNLIYTSSPFQAGVSAIAWLPGNLIASSSGTEIRIWQSP